MVFLDTTTRTDTRTSEGTLHILESSFRETLLHEIEAPDVLGAQRAARTLDL